ncbi:hypothetical protein HK100_006762 [Physocladia obscura]|uniref:Uncharacterized protein n=1 Tax=Physocladia obscura TaxID=109957 RepID=A0AAD5XF40_9FUNG|nr:hypothetical protein HK100_006762 [Physocladia obscura]
MTQLWSVLDGTGTRKIVSLAALGDSECDTPFSVAVDASLWLKSATTSIASPSESIQIRALTLSVLRLLESNIAPIFIFAYQTTNPMFESNYATHSPRNIQAEFANLLDILGVPWFVAAASACPEAESAELNSRGVVTAVMSNNAECFLYGAHMVNNFSNTLCNNVDVDEQVIRSCFEKNKKPISVKKAAHKYNSHSQDFDSEDDVDKKLAAPAANSINNISDERMELNLEKDHFAAYKLSDIFEHVKLNRNSLLFMTIISESKLPGISLKTVSPLCTSPFPTFVDAITSIETTANERLEAITVFLNELASNSMDLLSRRRPAASRAGIEKIETICHLCAKAIEKFKMNNSLRVSTDPEIIQKAVLARLALKKVNCDKFVKWFTCACDCDSLDVASTFFYTHVSPILRICEIFRQSRRIGEEETVPKISLIERIISLKFDDDGVELVKVVWSDDAMNLFGDTKKVIKEDDNEGKDFDNEIMAKTSRKVWLNAKFVKLAEPIVYENWKKRAERTKYRAENIKNSYTQKRQARMEAFFRQTTSDTSPTLVLSTLDSSSSFTAPITPEKFKRKSTKSNNAMEVTGKDKNSSVKYTTVKNGNDPFNSDEDGDKKNDQSIYKDKGPFNIDHPPGAPMKKKEHDRFKDFL